MKNKLSFGILYSTVIFLVMLFVIVTETRGSVITPGEEEYLIVVDKAPTPVGGMESIMKKVTYPDAALRAKIEGKVYVLALINENGEVDDVRVVKGIGMGCDEEASKVVKKTKFNPAQNKGANVKSKLALVINFKIS